MYHSAKIIRNLLLTEPKNWKYDDSNIVIQRMTHTSGIEIVWSKSTYSFGNRYDVTINNPSISISDSDGDKIIDLCIATIMRSKNIEVADSVFYDYTTILKVISEAWGAGYINFFFNVLTGICIVGIFIWIVFVVYYLTGGSVDSVRTTVLFVFSLFSGLIALFIASLSYRKIIK